VNDNQRIDAMRAIRGRSQTIGRGRYVMEKNQRAAARRLFCAVRALLMVLFAGGIWTTSSAHVLKVDVPAVRLEWRCIGLLGNGPVVQETIGAASETTADIGSDPAETVLQNVHENVCPGLLSYLGLSGGVQIYSVGRSQSTAIMDSVDHAKALNSIDNGDFFKGILSYENRAFISECFLKNGEYRCTSDTAFTNLVINGVPQTPEPLPFKGKRVVSISENLQLGITGICGAGVLSMVQGGTVTFNDFQVRTGPEGQMVRLVPISFSSTVACPLPLVGTARVAFTIEDGVEYTFDASDIVPNPSLEQVTTIN
jgi:hypothetical protein